MNKIVSVMCVAIMAYCLTSCCFPKEYATKTVYHRVVAGDTVWDICEKHFSHQDKYKNFNEFVYVVRQANKMAQRPHLQIGDIVEIPIIVEVKK